MSFQISTFVFIIISLIIFYISSAKYRVTVLMAFSLYFCFWLGKSSLIVLLVVSAVSFLVGVLFDCININKIWLKKIIVLGYLVLSISLLVGWKYLYNLNGDPQIKWTVPVGVSFYTFQTISYVIAVYFNQVRCEKSFGRFVLYMSWFPKLVSGPIERAGNFLPQLDDLGSNKFFEENRIISSFSYIIWGLFLKLIVADRAGIIVNAVFGSEEDYGSYMLVIASLLYTIQIYCDFAGYSNIAIGVSHMYGLELTQNFRTPYFSENISEFWRSWHISLSSFLKDYVYIPLGGNRKGGIRKAVNILIVFVICGIWHGKGSGFVVWGLLHGFYNIFADYLKKSRLVFLTRSCIGTLLTFFSVSFAWIFFKTGSLQQGVNYIYAIIDSSSVKSSLTEEIANTGSSVLEVLILFLSIALLIVCDYLAHRKKTVVPDLIIKTGEIRRNIVFLFCSVVILIFGLYGNQEVKDFIYMRF